MDAIISTPKGPVGLSSPRSSPNVAALLKIKIISWSQQTGLPVSVRVHFANRTYNLHKHLLLSKSGYFKKKLNESEEVELPDDFPGGPETFEAIALFIYGSPTLIDPFNVATLRCAAEFLEMTEAHSPGNLCERFDIYLNQVVLQRWDDTLVVLQRCQSLLPGAEDLLIVSRCIESLAFMACMEILDPERRRDHPIVTLEALATVAWSCQDQTVLKQILRQDLWIKDLIALQFPFFKRVIASLRRQGMKEKYVSPIILFYANEWVISRVQDDTIKMTLKGILDLLPMGEKASKLIPVGFYFSLLSRSLEAGLTNDSREKLQHQIASQLHLAQVEDFLLPNNELETMKRIFSIYAATAFNMELNPTTPSPRNSAVAELWDAYLTKIAVDPQVTSKRFMELIETLPLSSRQSHDHLYRALDTFLVAHPSISQDEKWQVCKYLNCQKLSQEVCIEAVQNELMPLRLIVQALFVQQLNTQQAFKECSDSFRYTNGGEFSGSISSSRYTNPRSQNLEESPCIDRSERSSRPLGFLLQKDKSELSKKDYESTSFRIQNLEQELQSLKRTLELQHISKKTAPPAKKENSQHVRPFGLEGRTPSRKRKPIVHMANCIGSVNFASHRGYATRLLKVLRRISSFGRVKSRRTSASGIKQKKL
ncbi:PREDICTED: BTB/POZ domain-containing protein At5g48130 [Ipomoea nil]|uniref:BTB/POZ domain-containing protein At5g48130 n=1 Tax=Ipomoea nil TaxID=35883 RepID=UPI000901D47A|nr:PREDICTED: BTB/POZ domain-containing protein At5g48130 [Ipomoea nil]